MEIWNHENKINLNFHFVEKLPVPNIKKFNQYRESFDEDFDWSREIQSARNGIKVDDEFFKLILILFP